MACVHRLVFCLCEDGIIGLEVVFGEQRFAIGDLHVEQRVAHAKE